MKVMVLHGGAGRWKLEKLDKALSVLRKAAEIGFKVLSGGSALDAVIEAVSFMEYSGFLNAGRGSCRDSSGGVSLDAGVMWMGRAGAVAHVKATWNAIRLARIVMEETPHILLVGDGADELAKKKGLPPFEAIAESISDDTVGAVALDESNRLASAVSTGGIKGKMPGRVGDSPIPGAGFWVSRCVASCSTGYGEAIIMAQPCRLVSILYEERGIKLSEALINSCKAVNGPCGLIALTINGEAAAMTTADLMPIAIARENEIKTLIAERGKALEL